MLTRSEFDQTILKYLPNSPTEKPRCAHFGICGGCRLQNYAYTDQVRAKEKALLELFTEILPASVSGKYAVRKAAADYGYRVKMEYVLAQDKFGLRALGRPWEVVDLAECHLIPTEIYKIVRDFYTQHKTLLTDVLYLVVRVLDAKLQLGFVTSAGSNFLAEQVAELALVAGFSSVFQLETSSPQIVSGDIVGVWGSSELTITLAGYKYQVSPASFTQNNLEGFASIIDYIFPYISPAELVYDLYCGIGTITLPLSKLAQKVIGVEESVASIELAQRNATSAGVSNIEFRAAKVADFLRDPSQVEYWDRKHNDPSTRFATGNPHINTIVVDPPRAGLNRKVTRRLLKYFNAETIIYISCNPFTQKQDLLDLADSYQVIAMQGFDLFPQTLHLENVAVLSRTRPNHATL